MAQESGEVVAGKRIETIDAYIEDCPEAVRPTLHLLRQTIKEAAPESVETISYKMPTFKLDGQPLVYFGAWKKHIALYPVTDDLEAAIPELARFKTGKGTVQLPLDQPLPISLIREIVACRLKEVRGESG